MRRMTSVILLTLTLALFHTGNVRGQSAVKDSAIQFTFMSLGYTYFLPGGDLKDRFGSSSMIGGSLLFKRKSNFFFGASGGVLFSEKVDDPTVLSVISTSGNQVIGTDGLFADVRLFQRGYHVALTFGKIFSFNKPNPNSGIIVMGGPGFLQHKIKIENISNSTPQLEGDYVKGYDHLTNGMEFHEFIGFAFFGNRQLLNFIGGFEFIQGFTKNRREYNFDTPGETEGNRIDLYYGIKAAWALPFYKKRPDAFYYY
jgi:hypothetical protein